MKNPDHLSSVSDQAPFPPLRRGGSIGFVAALLALGLGWSVQPVSAQDNQLEVDVRSNVVDTTHLWSSKRPKMTGEGGHGKTYGVLTVDEVKSDRDLEKPVDEKYLANLLVQQLEANGFRQMTKGQRPDILLTVSYGRGELANPYIRDTGEVGAGGSVPNAGSSHGAIPIGNSGAEIAASGGFGTSNAPTQTITGGMAQQLMDEKTPGYEAKLQKASFEKLYIRVTAWDYPNKQNYPDKRSTPRMLWKTIMVVDDPDNRDLNIVAAKMLEAGAPYFDKQPKDREVEVYKPLPNTRVNVGEPEVVGGNIR